MQSSIAATQQQATDSGSVRRDGGGSACACNRQTWMCTNQVRKRGVGVRLHDVQHGEREAAAETGAHDAPNAPGPGRGRGGADDWALQGQPTMRKRWSEAETSQWSDGRDAWRGIDEG